MAGTARVAVERIGSMQASAKDLLIADLKYLRQESGQPSLSEISKRSQGKFSKNAIDDHLSGRRSGIPNWRITSAYIHACHEFAKSTGLNIERLGTIEEWRDRWRAAQAGDTSALSPIRDRPDAATYSIMDIDRRPLSEFIGPTIAVSTPEPGVGTTDGIIPIGSNLAAEILSLRQSLPAHAGILIITNGPTSGTRFDVLDDLVTIGREPESTIVLDDPTVSRRHAVIHRNGTAFTVRDVGSRNGTYLHQRRLTAESTLPAFEELQIGIFRMWFIQGTGMRD